ncbi:MAG TPA: hypothetical protein PKX33_01740 [Candidatus Paceibacterota bacterium]|jgi:uncharacterized membrane protein required for colicin V production|nr:hypothetical protein [Candidatus Paceibacterota bacterium]
MEEEKRRPRLQIRLGGLVILIIIGIVLFKVDLKDKIQSEQFQDNIAFVKEKATHFWDKITRPLKEKISDEVEEYTEEQLEKMQENFKENILKLKDTEEEE